MASEWYLNGLLMPKELTLKLKTVRNDVDVKTLEGRLYTDFRDGSEEWEIGFGNIRREVWQNLKNIYNSQYLSKEYPLFVYPKYFVSYRVKIEISDEPYFLNGVLVNSPSVTLKRQDPVSPVPL
jgi:hypothetical protein